MPSGRGDTVLSHQGMWVPAREAGRHTSHSHVMWGPVSQEWRCVEMGPGSKGRSEMSGTIGLLPVPEGGTQPCWKLQVAPSLGLTQSWGHSGHLLWGVIFLKNTNSRPIWVSRPLQRAPHRSYPLVFSPCSGLPYFPPPALTHLQFLLGQSFVSHSKSPIIA